MSLKTEYSYNEDDFMQNGNGMQELTVTITLCEYRNLIEDIAYSEIKSDVVKEFADRVKDDIDNLVKGLESKL